MTPPAGSSPPAGDPPLEKTFRLLGWPLIQNALANHACSPVTKSICLDLSPETTFETATQALKNTAEMKVFLDSGEGFPIETFEDIRPFLQSAKENRIIEPLQGLAIAKLLGLCRSLKQFLEKNPESQHLNEKSARMDPLPSLLKELRRCIDDEGEIKENASPELKQACQEVAAAKQKLETRIRKFFSSSSYKDALQDTYITEREGRLVLPIRTDWRNKIDGIVHDSSGSGQTLYMEPTQIIPLNNQLKISKLRVEQEKYKVLQFLAREVSRHQETLMSNLEVLVELDLIHSKARLARLMDAKQCPLNTQGRVKLLQARNPELILNRQEVVSNHIAWDSSIRVIIISGPNTGGKTVTLKTVGLMSLMARAGLFLPVKEGSEIPFFSEVYADIGDEQNIQMNLSTFSAHLEKIIHILNRAKAGSLILLDELGIATDPLEGAALAEAVLLELKQKNVMTLVSTHYLSLKTLAQTQDGFINACTEFDLNTLAPTYRLIFGVPGNSAALETAERLGLQQEIIHKARDIYNAKDHRADTLLQNLTEQRLKLEKQHKEWQEKNDAIGKLAAEQKLITDNLREEEREFQKNKTKRLQSHVREGKQEIRRMLEEIKGSRDKSQIRKTEQQIASIGRVPLSASIKDRDDWSIAPEKLKEGNKVLIDSYGAAGILLENPQGKKKVRVKLGNFVTLVETQNLRGHPKLSYAAKNPSGKKIKVEVHAEAAPLQETTCDLRGLRYDEAQTVMERFISQALVHKVSRVTLIHGHGMGTIKKLVRDYLKTSGVCQSFQPGTRREGGDGVTVIELK